eukprot:4560861-Pleurochrysis_carterae.AAC.1
MVNSEPSYISSYYRKTSALHEQELAGKLRIFAAQFSIKYSGYDVCELAKSVKSSQAERRDFDPGTTPEEAGETLNLKP